MKSRFHVPWYHVGYHLERFFRWAFNKPYVPPAERYVVDDDGVRIAVTDPRGERSEVRRDALEAVYFLTTADGPFAPDLFLVFEDRDGARVFVPNGNPAYAALFDEAAGYPGSDADQALLASFSTDDGLFVLWRR